MRVSVANHLGEDAGHLALRRDVYSGLQKTPKSLPPKWFYDTVGSELFDQITRLPEYYPTRAEAEILRARSAEVASACRADTLVELGSGTSEKTRMLLDALRHRGSLRRFVPFDVDASVLSATATAIQRGQRARPSRGYTWTARPVRARVSPHSTPQPSTRGTRPRLAVMSRLRPPPPCSTPDVRRSPH